MKPARTALVPLREVLPLRHAVLRPGLPVEAAVFPGDEGPDVFHIAAYDVGGVVRACATFFPEGLPAEDAPAYRLRGMATDPAARGRGLGAAVLRAGLAEAAARGAGLVWCNARTSAAGFYARHGFVGRGEEFIIEGVGPHRVFAIKIMGSDGGDVRASP